MSLETALADLTKAVAENNALLSGLTEKVKAKLAVSSKTDEPVQGEVVARQARQDGNAHEVRTATEIHDTRSQTANAAQPKDHHDPDWGKETTVSEPVLAAFLEICAKTEDEDRRAVVQAHLRQHFCSNGIRRLADMDAGQRQALKNLMQRLLSVSALEPASGDIKDWTVEHDADWGKVDVVPDAVLRALAETILMIEDETTRLNGCDTLKQLLRGHAVRHFSEMNAEQREDAKGAMKLLLAGNHCHLEGWMWELLYMPPGDHREEAWEF